MGFEIDFSTKVGFSIAMIVIKGVNVSRRKRHRSLGLKSLTLFFLSINYGYTLGKQALGQGTDKKGSNRGLDLGSFTEFGVPSLAFDSVNSTPIKFMVLNLPAN